jgi:hypothetical protein
MRYQLTSPHYINEQVLPAGTIIGDGTPHPYQSNHTDNRIGRKKGDNLPPSVEMIPLDDDARQLYEQTYPDGSPPSQPQDAIPLTGAENAPLVKTRPDTGPRQPEPPNPSPAQAPKTGLGAQPAKPPTSPSTPQPPLKPELQKPPGHDSSKNPGDSKDTESAKAPDINKL